MMINQSRSITAIGFSSLGKLKQAATQLLPMFENQEGGTPLPSWF